MRDTRRAPFCWQNVAALERIRTGFEGREVATAIAVYVGMTEISNEQRADSFTASKERIAAKAGLSKRTADTRIEGLIALGLVEVQQRRGPQGGDLGHEYVLLPYDVRILPPAEEGVQQPQGEGAAVAPSPGCSARTPFQEPKPLFSLNAVEGSGKQEGDSRRPPRKDDVPLAVIQTVWGHAVTRCQPANPNLTPTRERMLRKALIESGGIGQANAAEAGHHDAWLPAASLCMRAIDGLVEYQKRKGGALDLSRVFQTRPGGSPLPEQIEWWASQASGGSQGSGFIPSDEAAEMSQARSDVRRAAAFWGNPLARQKGEEAMAKLAGYGITVEMREVPIREGMDETRLEAVFSDNDGGDAA